MPLGRGIAELFEAIPERIEVSGHEPTWRVTGGSFESVLAFAREAYDDPTVIGREDRSRWWPRVTLTVTTDPALAAEAPPLDTFAADPEPAPAPAVPAPAEPRPTPRRRAGGRHAADVGPQVVTEIKMPELPEQRTDDPGPDSPLSFGVLDEIFAHQEELRRKRLQIPGQRPPAG
jgi:hypothetical protein